MNRHMFKYHFFYYKIKTDTRSSMREREDTYKSSESAPRWLLTAMLPAGLLVALLVPCTLSTSDQADNTLRSILPITDYTGRGGFVWCEPTSRHQADRPVFPELTYIVNF